MTNPFNYYDRRLREIELNILLVREMGGIKEDLKERIINSYMDELAEIALLGDTIDSIILEDEDE